MINTENLEDILNCQINGYRQYTFAPTVHLSFVSRNLCDMLGCGKEELASEDMDMYSRFVHPDDRLIYSEFINKLSKGEISASAQYRIVKRSGEVVFVSDSATSKLSSNGVLTASSVLTDITEIKNENTNLRFLNETIPCGFVKYTCEKNPRVTYINEQMLNILRVGETKDGEIDYLEMYKSNIYLMIPMTERRKFSHFLNQVYQMNSPVSGEMNLLRCDGTKARIYGWVTKTVNKDGTEEFQSVCMDVTERYETKKSVQNERYLKALKDVYDEIFEFDFSNRTVKCFYEKESQAFKWVQNVAMRLEDATERWIEASVDPSDRDKARAFFKDYNNSEGSESDSKPHQIQYLGISNEMYMGIFLPVDSSASYFCCRRVAEESDSDSLRNENLSLRNMNENMQSLVMRFTDGIVAFEIEDNFVKPLYASDNICDFFGYTKEEWIGMAQHRHSIKSFVSKSGLDYEEFMELLENGEAEFEYIDVKTQTPQRKKAVCTQAFDGSKKRYVMLYNINGKSADTRETVLSKGHIYIRTFGYFDVFVNEKPIAFRNKKSKELLALLVDRRGGFVTSEEAIGFLWEDEPVNSVTLSRYRKVALRLKNILEEYGIPDIMESVDGKRRIVPEKVRCDLYDYLTQKEEYAQLFKGSYLTNYSWGEITLGELLNEYTAL